GRSPRSLHSFLYLISRGLFMTFNFLGPGLTVNVEAKVKEQIILDSSEFNFLDLAFISRI
uniref:hypothetical protein n=1 Tax=Parasutterella sp. TaxID=2049037 RepID=UPI003AB7831E